MQNMPRRRKRKPLPFWAYIALPALALAIPLSSIEDTYQDGVRTEEIKVARLANIEEAMSVPKAPEARPDFIWVKTTGVDGSTTWIRVPFEELETL